MSKIYTQYLKLKETDNGKVYLFKSGIFYIFVGDDAKKISPILNLKLVNLNDEIMKCGFPVKSLENYLKDLEKNNINFEIVDLKYNKIENYSDYMNNKKLQEIVLKIIEIDFDDISYKEAYNKLYSTHEELKKIYN